jgi:hypothetical protein
VVELLKESACQANKDAQHSPRLACFNGNMTDVQQNCPFNLIWLVLATGRKHSQYVPAYAGAHALATAAAPQKASTPWQHFNHAIEPIDDAASLGDIVYLHGFSAHPGIAFNVADKLHDEIAADFDVWHETARVGKPEWMQSKPSHAPPTLEST